jgi:hypothetical protein
VGEAVLQVPLLLLLGVQAGPGRGHALLNHHELVADPRLKVLRMHRGENGTVFLAVLTAWRAVRDCSVPPPPRVSTEGSRAGGGDPRPGFPRSVDRGGCC